MIMRIQDRRLMQMIPVKEHQRMSKKGKLHTVKGHLKSKSMYYSPNLTGKRKKEMINWLKKQIKEESESAEMYDKTGFDLIAIDERKHVQWLKNALGALMI